jgi:hypothetical protein
MPCQAWMASQRSTSSHQVCMNRQQPCEQGAVAGRPSPQGRPGNASGVSRYTLQGTCMARSSTAAPLSGRVP